MSNVMKLSNPDEDEKLQIAFAADFYRAEAMLANKQLRRFSSHK
jgi:hypothetical protein